MFKTGFAALALVFVLAGCGAVPQREAAKRYGFYWGGQGIRATLAYQTIAAPPSGSTCAGGLSIENVGGRKYNVLLFNVKALSASGEVLATDRFSLSSSLNPGGKAEIPADPHNPLNPVVITQSYRACPSDMAALDVKLEAF